MIPWFRRQSQIVQSVVFWGSVFCLLALVGLLAGGVMKIRADGRAAAEARVSQAVQQGQIAAGRDAVAITDATARERETIQETRRDNETEIRNAPGADQAVDPALAAAGRRGLCRYAAYRNRSECLTP